MNSDRQEKIGAFARDVTKSAFEFMNPFLTNYEMFAAKIGRQVRVKAAENIQYGFDVELDRLVREQLEAHGISGKIFSEESEWYELGAPDFKVVYDPFCNSTLAARTMLDAGLGVSVFGYGGDWLATVILDYQTGIAALAEAGGGAQFWQVQSGAALQLGPSDMKSLRDAWLVITLESRRDRSHLAEARAALEPAKRVTNSSGHVYWLRLSAGKIDGYTDPFGGEELYEMFACTVAQAVGCTVTDREGNAFDAAQQLKRFEADRHARFYPVAAATPELHEELLAALRAPDSKSS